MTPLTKAIDAAVQEGLFPGGVLRVERHGRCLHASAHGCTRLGPEGRPVTLDTCFDLASLTKVLATASVAMQAVARDALALDRPAVRLLPELEGSERARITAEHLLAHTSGLPAWRPYFRELPSADLARPAGRDALRARCATEPLLAPPGERREYSDLGFILLGWLLERALGLPFADLVHSLVSAPLGREDLFFVDLLDPSSTERTRAGRVFAATEQCAFRGRLLEAEVHDENAYALGGVAGHAGLFGTAEAVARVGQAWLAALVGREGVFEPEVMQRFAQARPREALGFDRPESEGSQAGSRLSAHALGHLGFTGTSVWIEPERELCVVLLTNRVHLGRGEDGVAAFRAFRSRLHDLVLDTLEHAEREDGPA